MAKVTITITDMPGGVQLDGNMGSGKESFDIKEATVAQILGKVALKWMSENANSAALFVKMAKMGMSLSAMKAALDSAESALDSELLSN